MEQNATEGCDSNVKADARSRLKAGIGALSELKDIEQLISSKFESEASDLTEISAYLHDLGGKRMRPALCVLVAKALNMNPIPQEIVAISAGIELIHMATLLHDDIIDKSELRRHQQSAFIKFGTAKTLLAGDFLLVRAFSLCAQLDQTIIEATERACIELTEGEILEIPLYERNASLDDALVISKKKTAALFALASFSAAHLAQLSEKATSQFLEFGYSLGIAFQILDDILDVTASEDLLGKVAGIDIRERKPSVVNVLWLQSGSDLAQHLRSAKSPFANEDEYVDLSLTELRESSVIEQARQLAQSYAEQARTQLHNALEGVTYNSDVLATIESFIDYTLQRLR